MANLKEVIGSILRDTILAQHQANQFSQSLSESYKKSGRTSGFRLPAVALGEFEIDLRYSIKEGIEEVEEEDVDYQETNRYVRYIARESAELMVKTLMQCVQKTGLDYQKEGYAFIDQLTSNRKYIRQLAKRLFAILTTDVTNLMSEAKTLDAAKIITILMAAVEKEVLTEDSLKDLFALSKKVDLPTDIKKAFQSAVSKEIKNIIAESQQVSFRKIQRFGSMQVIIDSEELGKLPESAIQHFKMRVTPQTIAPLATDEEII